MGHVVWDWNGTLFNDLDVVVEATNVIFAGYGLGPYTLGEFREFYTRPIWLAYERMLGRELADGEWERLDVAFHDAYHSLMESCGLADDAVPTVAALAGAGHTQSVLSMWRHDRLGPAVDRLGLGGTFLRVDGLRPEQAGGAKAEFLVRHLAALGGPADVLMIGDSIDDAVAAQAAGARALLYAGGMQSRAELDGFGVPVLDRLGEITEHL